MEQGNDQGTLVVVATGKHGAFQEGQALWKYISVCHNARSYQEAAHAHEDQKHNHP